MALSVRFVRRCPDGRWVVACLRCGNLLRVVPRELARAECPYCQRAWESNGRPPE